MIHVAPVALALLLFIVETECGYYLYSGDGYEITYETIPASQLRPGNVKPTKSVSTEITATSTGGATVGPELHKPQNKGSSSSQEPGPRPSNSIAQTPTCTSGSVNCGIFTHITQNVTKPTASPSHSLETSTSTGEGYKVIYYPIPASLLQPGNVKPTNTASIKITSTSTGGATVCPEPQNKGQSSCQGCPNNSISQTPTCTPGISVNCGRRLSFTYITKNITNATANSSPSPQTSSSVEPVPSPSNSIYLTPTCTSKSVNCGLLLTITQITQNVTKATASPLPSPQSSAAAETCGAMDVGVLIDASESISEKDFQNVKWTLINITNTFKVSKDGTHFGVIVYSDDPVLHVKFDDSEYQKPSNLAKKILALPWIGEGTRTDKAVELANTALFTPGAGMRTNKPQVLILFTDGNTNPVTSRSPKEILKPLQEKNIKVLAMGMGEKVNDRELKLLAHSHTIHMQSPAIETLTKFLSTITDASCGS